MVKIIIILLLMSIITVILKVSNPVFGQVRARLELIKCVS